jgi:hypothetical protein
MIAKRAKIHWLTQAQGGRLAPPAGPRYSTVARFEQLEGLWPTEAWSLVLIFSNDASDVTVSPLVEEAPEALFVSGSRFDLFEGARKVAEGEIL